MSGRRRLEDALQMGKEIDMRLDERDPSFRLNKISYVEDIEFGDIGATYSINFSHDSQYFAAGCSNGAVQVYSVKQGKKKRPLQYGSNFGLPVTCVKFYPYNSSCLVTADSQGDIKFWDLMEWAQRGKILEKGNEIETLDFSHDGKIFATAGKDKTIRVYDSDSHAIIKTFPGAGISNEDDSEFREVGHGRKVFALKFHPFDDNVFITGGWDKCIKIWDTRSAHSVGTIWGPYVCGGDSLDISMDNILTGSWVTDEALQIWDFKSGSLVETIPFPSEKGAFLYCARFVSSDLIAAGGSGSRDLKLLYRHTHEVAGCIDNSGKVVQALDVGDGGHLMVIGGASDVLRLVRLL
ncbi:vegetative incompatibility protein HET-E-1-like [Xenia sp. Carnegie-2017]|uniref:vegetative incompatibility protein HET-E-1-like n=1 Tax=Xenia sp. Carnegie-2017 TaxID=2897299 RepID=UPI001F0402D5|nr:vegetative incompatibility protein HET-E-1-like [Xenia sp. Carnegie-2017]